MKIFKPVTAHNMNDCLKGHPMYKTARALMDERLQDCIKNDVSDIPPQLLNAKKYYQELSKMCHLKACMLQSLKIRDKLAVQQIRDINNKRSYNTGCENSPTE